MEIFKELVNDYPKNKNEENKIMDQTCSEQAGLPVFLFPSPPASITFLLLTACYGDGMCERLEGRFRGIACCVTVLSKIYLSHLIGAFAETWVYI